MRVRPCGFDLVDNCVTCAAREDNFFCNLGPRALEAFNAIAFANIYPEGSILYTEGQAPRGIFLICRGSAKVSISSAEGKTIITKIARAGQVLGLSSVLSGHPYKATAETLEPSQVNFVRREDLPSFLHDHHEACVNVVGQLTEACEADADHIRAIELSHSATEKLANLIISWCPDSDDDEPGRCQMLLTHEDLSQLIGTSRETVTRLLKDFRARKLISIKGACLTILNRAALRSLVLV